MKVYLKLLRIQDQYTQTAFAIAAGLFLHDNSLWLVLWFIAVLFISFAVFIVNEVVDRKDTDKYSWNGVHVTAHTALNRYIVFALFFVCAGVGLYSGYLSGLFVWSCAMFVIGVSYSLPPIRLKARMGGDILAQLAVWFWIPFFAPLVYQGKFAQALPLFLPVSLIVWSTFYPYQLADFTADKKVGLGSTHVRLGLRQSVIFGFVLGLAGVFFFITRPQLLFDNLYLIPLCIMVAIALGFYGCWLTLGNEKILATSIQRSIILMKPYAPLLLVVWGVWWWVW